MDNSVKPKLRGRGAAARRRRCPMKWVLVGNHRDAWGIRRRRSVERHRLHAGDDPRPGEMASKGIRPRRTIIACSWDGEEVGLTGSTEWGEQFAADLGRKLVAYLNVDSSASGPISRGAPSGRCTVLVEVSRTLGRPSGTSLYEAWKTSAADLCPAHTDKSLSRWQSAGAHRLGALCAREAQGLRRCRIQINNIYRTSFLACSELE